MAVYESTTDEKQYNSIIKELESSSERLNLWVMCYLLEKTANLCNPTTNFNYHKKTMQNLISTREQQLELHKNKQPEQSKRIKRTLEMWKYVLRKLIEAVKENK